MRTRTLVLFFLLAFLAAALTARVHAQTTDALRTAVPSGIVRGEVLDAESAAPLAGATVALTPASQTALMPRERSAFLSAARTTTTGADGRYAFGVLAPGAYVLRVHRMGYRAATVEVTLAAPTDARVSVGLTMAPVLLQAMEVRSRPIAASDTAAVRRTREADDGRIAAARARQAQYASTDARELTRADVDEAVTLGESDLLRAFQRLPGVTTRDDYTSELWVRGARWDLTRVQLDGMPLFAPFHTTGLLTAVPADAIGSAVLLPGVRPASMGEGAAGVVDLRTRSGSGDGRLSGTGDLNVFGGGLALEQRSRGGRVAWSLASRRSYGDPFGLRAPLRDIVEEYREYWGTARYDFADVVGRLDVALGGGWRIEASGFAARDARRGSFHNASPSPDVTVLDTLTSFGPTTVSTLGRVTLVSPIGRVLLRQTAGVSRWDYRNDHRIEAEGVDWHRAENAAIHFATLEGELAPQDTSAWRAGWALSRHRTTGEGIAPGFRPVHDDARTVGSVWVQDRWTLLPRLTMAAGLRVDAGASLPNGGTLRPMPRLETRLALDSSTTLSLGAGRAFQYAQARSENGFFDGETLRSGLRWLVAGEATPVVRADVATLGVERWLASSWLATATAYLRHSSGLAMEDRRPGLVDYPNWLVTGSESARGLEVGLRRLAGRVTGQVGWSLAHATTTTQGLRFPANQDQRQSLDAMAMLRATRSVRVGAAYTLATGAPFTRRIDSVWDFGSVTRPPVELRPATQDAPNALRARAYESLDLLVDWSFRVKRTQLEAYAQLRNALDRRNDAAYWGTTCTLSEFATGGCEASTAHEFLRGTKAWPLLGLRVRF